MFTLTAMLIAAGTTTIQSDTISMHSSFEECAVHANAVTNLIWELSGGDAQVVASQIGIIVIESSNGDQIAITCEEKETV